MRKVLSAEQIREADADVIANEPIRSIDLMERASRAFVEKFKELVPLDQTIAVVCGPGNNGGDGFAIARMLLSDGFQVSCYEKDYSERSVDCSINRTRFIETGGAINKIGEDLIQFDQAVIVDGLFGSGLNRPIEDSATQALIGMMNESNKAIVAIDIPSGLYADEVSINGAIVRADHTICFERPKLTFLLPETGSYVGDFHTVEIGLRKNFLESQPSPYHLTDLGDIAAFLKPRLKFSHKGNYGRVAMAAGSYGKMGAAVLSATACMKVGAGLLTMHIPSAGNNIVQTCVPEAMTVPDEHANFISSIQIDERSNCCCLGPGIGTEQITSKALSEFLEDVDIPLVLDADALNIIAKNKGLINKIPKGSILTPHAKEFERLMGHNENSLEKIELMRSFSLKTGVIIVSKGAHTVITDKEGNVHFNTTGNPGMATAGSGDVLSGMIVGLLAQGIDSRSAAIAGVYLHGLAGDIAQKKVGEMSLMASDLLDAIPESISNAKKNGYI